MHGNPGNWQREPNSSERYAPTEKSRQDAAELILTSPLMKALKVTEGIDFDGALELSKRIERDTTWRDTFRKLLNQKLEEFVESLLISCHNESLLTGLNTTD